MRGIFRLYIDDVYNQLNPYSGIKKSFDKKKKEKKQVVAQTYAKSVKCFSKMIFNGFFRNSQMHGYFLIRFVFFSAELIN